jgi:hypothetical protein
MTLLQQATLSESNVKPVKRKGNKKEKIKNKEKKSPGKRKIRLRSIKNEIKKSNQYSPHRLCEMEIAGDCRLVNKNNLLRASSLSSIIIKILRATGMQECADAD